MKRPTLTKKQLARSAESAVAEHGGCFEGSVSEAWEDMRLTYGAPFLRYLVVVYFGIKGVSFSIVGAVMLPLFKSLGVSGDGYQLAAMISGTPWSAKGWIGVLSDCFPIGRYHKRGWLLLSSCIGTVGVLGLLSLPDDHPVDPDFKWVVALLFVAVNWQNATYDLLSEGKYAEIMREKSAGPQVISLIWFCINVGGLAGSIFIYASIDRWGIRPLILLSLVPPSVAAVLTARGAVPEEPARGWKFLRIKMMSQPRLFLLAFFMAMGVLLIALAAAVGSQQTRLLVTFVVSLGLSAASFFVLPRALAMSNLYMMLTRAMYVDLSGALSYYYTAGPSCAPGAPGFSYSYYLTVSNFVGAIGGVIGSLAFQGMQDWSFRAAFMVTTFVQVFASSFDLVIVKRWNVAAGFSDEATYLFGDAACQQLAAMLQMMPMALLTSRLCPRGAEATVYAILAGFQNFGSSVASVVGVSLTQHYGIQTAGASVLGGACDFERLGDAVVVGHMLLPLVCVPLTYWLVPSVNMADEAAFACASPAPSFASPAASPASSCKSSPRCTPEFVGKGGSGGFAPGFSLLPPGEEDADSGAAYRHLAGGPDEAGRPVSAAPRAAEAEAAAAGGSATSLVDGDNDFVMTGFARQASAA